MGILNVTPDSFSDGGTFLAHQAALDHALRMIDDGADVVDVGGESTRPNSSPISATEEQARILPVIEAIVKQIPGTPVSVDTYHAETAACAAQAGAEIVNDVSGFLWDPEMAATCAKLGCGAVIMHTRGTPGEWAKQPPISAADVVPLVLNGLQTQADHALRLGIARERIVLDPGFGFGKIRDENFPLLAEFGQLQSLGFPLMAGLSRKSFLCGRTPVTAEDRKTRLLAATLAANTAAILAGAHILRVHDVAESRAAADLADATLRAASAS